VTPSGGLFRLLVVLKKSNELKRAGPRRHDHKRREEAEHEWEHELQADLARAFLGPLTAFGSRRLGVRPQRLSRFVPKTPKEMSRLQKRMAMAGYHGVMPALVFAAFEMATPIALAGGMLLFGPPGPMRVTLAMFCGFVGYILPSLVLQRKIALRKKII